MNKKLLIFILLFVNSEIQNISLKNKILFGLIAVKFCLIIYLIKESKKPKEEDNIKKNNSKKEFIFHESMRQVIKRNTDKFNLVDQSAKNHWFSEYRYEKQGDGSLKLILYQHYFN